MRGKLIVALLTGFMGLTFTFVLIRMMPGDVVHIWAQRIAAEQGVPYSTAYEIAKTRLNHDPTVPIPIQYLKYVRGVFAGNLGESMQMRVPVSRIILGALPWTLFIASLALFTSFVLGIVLGLVVTWRRSPVLETLMTVGTTASQSVPDFLFALILMIVFGIHLRLFPLRGAYGVDVDPGFNLAFLLDVLHHAALPVAAFTLHSAGGWALAMKGSAAAVLHEDYITVARAKGLTDSRIITRYLGRNAMLPLITSLAIALGSMFSGAMLIESLFSYPGIGYFMAEAINNRDYTLMQGLFLVTTMATIFFTLLADLVYARLDPRIGR